MYVLPTNQISDKHVLFSSHSREASGHLLPWCVCPLSWANHSKVEPELLIGVGKMARPEPNMKFKKRIGLNRIIGLILVEKSGFRVISISFGLTKLHFFELEPN